MFRRKDRSSPVAITTLIGQHVKVHGDVEFVGGLHVEGTVFGSVRAPVDADGALSVSDNGVIEGSVVAQNVVVNGQVNGDIVASGRVVLGARARVRGDVQYAVLEMASGAEISGRLVRLAAAGVASSSRPASENVRL
jgi:cytoskeletal protein CcmA (bactofilin family)